MSDCDNSFTTIKAFLLGAICGAGAALLFAPKSGEETRKLLSEKKDDTKKAFQDTSEKIVQKGHSVIEEGKGSFDSLKTEAVKLYDEGKSKLSNISEEISKMVEEGKNSVKETIKEELSALEEELNQKQKQSKTKPKTKTRKTTKKSSKA